MVVFRNFANAPKNPFPTHNAHNVLCLSCYKYHSLANKIFPWGPHPLLCHCRLMKHGVFRNIIGLFTRELAPRAVNTNTREKQMSALPTRTTVPSKTLPVPSPTENIKNIEFVLLRINFLNSSWICCCYCQYTTSVKRLTSFAFH